MNIIYRLLAIPKLALKRLWAQRWMTLITIFGLTISVALFMTVPLYADGVNFRILEERLSAQTENRKRPPFAYMFSYIGAWRGPVEWEAIQDADDYLMERGSLRLGMPRTTAVRHVESSIFDIFPQDTVDYGNEDARLTFIKFATVTDHENRITITEGRPAQPVNRGQAIEVLVSKIQADAIGFQAGERYDLFRENDDGLGDTFEVMIAGVWEPIDPDDEYWVYSETTYEDLLIIPESTFANVIAPSITGEVNLAAWYFVLDGSRLALAEVEPSIGALRAVERRLQNLLPETNTLLDPTEALTLYTRDVQRLNRTLFAFNLPTIGLILAFIGLIGTLWADRRRNELAVARSRGSTFVQLIGIALLEAVIIGIIAFALGTLLSLILTGWMGRVRSFLDFSSDSTVRVVLSRDAILVGLSATTVSILAKIIPTISAAQQTVVSYKLVQARALKPAWWLRAYLDIILIGISAYGIYQLRQQGGLFAVGEVSSGSPFQNPLLFLLPALIIFATTLFSLRLLPWIMSALAYLLRFTESISLLQAARYLARSPRIYTTPLILLVLTVSFAVYTASLAKTLDFHLYDQYFYSTGADINMFTPPLVESGFFGELASSDPNDFLILPMNEYESIDGVVSATRVGRYNARSRIGTDTVSGVFIGLDRETFAQTAVWRWDYSSYRLGSLMNALGNIPEGILVPESFLRRSGLSVGDTMVVEVQLPEQTIELPAQIVGTFTKFPTWYEEESGILFVGNLDTIFDLAGNIYPYRVWLDTDNSFQEDQFRRNLDRIGLFSSSWKEPQTAITAGLRSPDRQGLFGLLSVGFLAATLLTVLGLGLYAMFSYQRRVVELGILRAVGLSKRLMTRLIAWELALLIAFGLALGSLLGIGVSQLFIPYLQVGTQAIDLTPVMVTEISWEAISQVYLLFGILFVLSFVSLAIITLRMRIFTAIKMGEAV